MEDLIKTVRTYRLTSSLTDRLRLGEKIFRAVEPQMRFFVFNAIPLSAAEDVLQEILKGIATGLPRFEGGSAGEFWAWCHRIARNKINDHLRRLLAERMQPMPPEELWRLVEVSTADSSLSAADRHDLDYVMKLLTATKPECYEYLWKHFVIGLAYGEIAEEQNLNYDNVRMRIGRCLDEAKALVA